jgi:predicted 2-oxoglutarate/Fe(II)-dependent dioxygenase YbiX
VIREVLREPTVFLIHGFLSSEECVSHVERAEALGFEEASIGGSGEVYREYRDNDRVILDDADLSQATYERARPHLVAEWMMRSVSGFSERWRYYRYAPGQKFKVHGDGCHRRPNGEESQFTFLIYLNDDVEGGSTNFHLPGGEVMKVRPRAGSALVFLHKHLHEGGEVTRGVKYVLRTDVMYSPVSRR